MADPVEMVELWRGSICESRHRGHAVICDGSGQIVEAWGDPQALIYPRSSCKMVQALPLIESGASDRFGLTDAHLALACASHQGAAIHTGPVNAWIADLGLTDDAFRCGAQPPSDKAAKHALIRAGELPCQVHNNCSGKHAGFLTLAAHLGAGPEYVEVDHPVQIAVKAAFEEVTGEISPTHGVDGCSAPNFATTVHGLARAMAAFATAKDAGGARAQASARLVQAMITYPELVAGEGRACTELMRAANEQVALKTGAEGVFVAILPERGLGIALKIADGATRASEAAITALLVKLGVLDQTHLAALKRLNGPVANWRGLHVGMIRTADGFS